MSIVDVEEFLRESNAIEGVHDEDALKDSLEAWQYLRGQDEVTHDIVREVHGLVLQNRQPDIAGEYRDVRVWVGGRACPPAAEIRDLLDDLLGWIPENAVDAIEWHIEFERIHPFRDGNGRVGRLLYLWHCRQLGLEPVMWRAEDRQGYYSLFKQPGEEIATRS